MLGSPKSFSTAEGHTNDDLERGFSWSGENADLQTHFCYGVLYVKTWNLPLWSFFKLLIYLDSPFSLFIQNNVRIVFIWYFTLSPVCLGSHFKSLTDCTGLFVSDVVERKISHSFVISYICCERLDFGPVFWTKAGSFCAKIARLPLFCGGMKFSFCYLFEAKLVEFVEKLKFYGVD